MNIKVTGVTNMKQLQQLDGLNIDFAGLVFYKPSPRFAGNKFSKKEIKSADLDIKTVGMFKNADYDEIMQTVKDVGIDIVQLHGDESPYLCEAIADEIEVIKAFEIGSETSTAIDHMLEEYDDVCDYYLFHTAPKKGLGSAGNKFDWKKILASKIEKPFFLSGGIAPADGPLIKNFKHPDLYGIDLNTNFEKEPGVKDMALILQFIHGLKLNIM